MLDYRFDLEAIKSMLYTYILPGKKGRTTSYAIFYPWTLPYLPTVQFLPVCINPFKRECSVAYIYPLYSTFAVGYNTLLLRFSV